MPNGESKNWIRLMITLESFHHLNNKWPTKIHLYPFFIDELKEKLTLKDFEKLQSKLELIADGENPFLAQDSTGSKFDYNKDPHIKTNNGSKAIDWLNIKIPEYHD